MAFENMTFRSVGLEYAFTLITKKGSLELQLKLDYLYIVLKNVFLTISTHSLDPYTQTESLNTLRTMHSMSFQIFYSYWVSQKQ